jgi:hypothetical protein
LELTAATIQVATSLLGLSTRFDSDALSDQKHGHQSNLIPAAFATAVLRNIPRDPLAERGPPLPSGSSPIPLMRA